MCQHSEINNLVDTVFKSSQTFGTKHSKQMQNTIENKINEQSRKYSN